MNFSCIYCRSTLPEREASKAHIWAASLGGSVCLHKAVCQQCNGHIATRLEDPFKDRWAWLLLFLGIIGRREKGPRFKAKINLVGREIEVNIRSLKEIPNIPPVLEKNTEGKEIIHLFGSSDYVEKKRREYEKKRPATIWQEHDTSELHSREIKFPVDVDSLDESFSRRLAAKIAFEFWGLKRNPTVLLDREYDALRDFILNGNEPSQRPLAGLVSDEIVVSGNLGNIDIPNHAVCLNLHPSNSLLGAIVVFFGMFYYWVILTPRYPLRTSINHLTVISPQTKASLDALLTGSGRPPRIPWERILVPEKDRVHKAWKMAREKFEKLTKS